jgi:signal transduction histidine kinase
VIDHPALQDVTASGPGSPEAARLTASILAGDVSVDEAIERVARHLLADARIEAVMAALTSFPPDDARAWRELGGRAWVREWVRPYSDSSFVPPPGAGPEAALTMPWMSRLLRRSGVVAITDRNLLPPDAEKDAVELGRFGVDSLISSAWTSGGVMFGSMSGLSLESGTWSDTCVQDFTLLNAAIASRLALEQSRRALAEAIEAGAEAQAAYQHFFGAVGHELRTPLAAVMGYTEVLLDDAAQAPETPVAAALLADGPVILRACEQLLAVVDSLLGAGRAMGSGDQRRAVTIADAVADVVHWHRTPAETAGVVVTADVDPTLTVWAHAVGVRQILTNLVGNAITHHRPGGGGVHVSTERLVGESGQPMVRIVVRDDGPGLDPEQLTRVFEPFVRFAAHGAKGTGLGLPISRTVAERDGGAVRGESAPGTGSSFWLELPALAPPAP